MGRNIIDIIIKADDKASAQLKAVTGNTKNLGAALGQVGVMMAVAGAAVAGAIGGIVYKTGMWADAMLDTSRALGVETEFLSQMEFALKRHGSGLDNFTAGMRVLINAMNEAKTGGAEYKEIFDRLGIAIFDSSGKARSATDVFMSLADVIADSKTGTDAASAAIELLSGRAALKLVPMMKQGSAGIRELMQKADALGGTLTKDTALAADRFGDALEDVRTSLKGVGLAIFDVYNKDLTEFSNKLSTDTIPTIGEWIEANKNLVDGIGKTAIGAVALGIGMKIIAGASANPIIALTAALIAQAGILEITSGHAKDLAKSEDLLAGMTGRQRENMAKWLTSMGIVNKAIVDEAENTEDAAAAWEQYRLAQEAATYARVNAASIATAAFEKEMQAAYAAEKIEAKLAAKKAEWYSRPFVPEPENIEQVLLYNEALDGTATAIQKLLYAKAGKGAFELDLTKVPVPDMPSPGMDQWNESLREFDVTGMEVARNLTSGIGNAFYQIAQGGASAAEAFKQAWSQAIGSVIARLAEMAVWKIGGYLLSAFLLNEGGEVTKGAGGFEVYGGTRGRDTVPALIGGGEAVIPSPTMDKLKRFLDGAEGSMAGVVNVNPMFFSGSRADSFLAADFIQRRLDSQDRFIIRGSL